MIYKIRTFNHFIGYISSLFVKKSDMILYLFSRIISTLIVSISSILIARYFSKYDFGLIKTVIVYSSMVSIFINFGLIDYFLIRFSQKKDIKIAKKIVGNLIFMAFFIFPFSIAIYFMIYEEGLVFFIIIYLSNILGLISNKINIFFQAYNKFKVISVINVTNSIILLSSISSFVFILQGNLAEYFYLLLIVSILSLFISLIAFFKFFGLQNLIEIFLKPGLSPNLFRLSLPFFLSGLMSYIYMSSDILILSFLKSPEEVARYTIPLTFINAAYLIPTVLYNYFIPKLSASYTNKNIFIKNLKDFLITNTVLSFPVFIILLFFSKDLLTLVFTFKYIDSLSILKILSFVFILHSFCFVFGAVLTASNRQKTRTTIQSIAAFINIFLNFIFIPIYGAEGAAATTAITEIIIFFCYLFFSMKTIK